MKINASIPFLLALLLSGCVSTSEIKGNQKHMTKSDALSKSLLSAVPAMSAYSDRIIKDELWNRPELSHRDRSLIVISALITRNDSIELPHYIDLGLDSGLTPTEISETITHLAFYAGWPNASSAALVAYKVFEQRHIDFDKIDGAEVTLLPIDDISESKRVTLVQNSFGKIAPGVVKYTTDALFQNLWLRPGLAPRDRSLITVSALVTAGQVAQIPFHLNRAMDNGLTRDQASEMLTQLAFVAGWPNVFSAMPIFGDVFDARQKK